MNTTNSKRYAVYFSMVIDIEAPDDLAAEIRAREALGKMGARDFREALVIDNYYEEEDNA
jgi:hypothetical protein